MLGFMFLSHCSKNNEAPKDPFIYAGDEQPGRISGFGDSIGEFKGHWLQLPSGVEYAGPIRGVDYYRFQGGVTPPVFGNGYYVQLTIPLKNPKNLPIDFPAGMILIPILDDAPIYAPQVPDVFMDDEQSKPQIHKSIMRVVADNDCNHSWVRSWLGDDIADWFTPTGKCAEKNYKAEKQTGVSVKKGRTNPMNIPSENPWTVSTSGINKAPAANSDIQYVTLHLYCGNEHYGRPSWSSARFYPPFVSESPLLQWFCGMLEGKNIDGCTDKIQGLLWKVTDGDEMLSQDDIDYIKSLPDE
jgi:hypothetical protein